MTDTLAVAQAIYDAQFGRGAWLDPHQMRDSTRDTYVKMARAAIDVIEAEKHKSLKS